MHKITLNQNDRINFSDRRSDVKDKLQSVQYSTRFATGLYYEQGVEIDVPWVAKYFRSDPVIVFIAADSKKRGQGEYLLLIKNNGLLIPSC